MKIDYSNKKSVKAILRRSFARGFGSVLSLQGRTTAIHRSSVRDDAAAIRGDWQRVGAEFEKAMVSLKR